MQLLVAVNLILPALGEKPVSALDNKNPTVAVITPQITNCLRDVLLKGWWFNTYSATLYPDSEGFVWIPDNTLAFRPERVNAVVRGSQLFNRDTRTYSFAVGTPVTGTLFEQLDFELLPESAAQFVFYSALVLAYCNDIGADAMVKVWADKQNQALTLMSAEHLRFQNYTTRKSARYRRLRHNMRG